jgi:DNA-binding NarL/FixJ family response regulator
MDVPEGEGGGPSVMVVRSSMAGATKGLGALVDGRARIVLSSDDIDVLDDAQAAVNEGFAVIATRLVDRMRSVPSLTPDDRALLELVAAGASNLMLAAGLQRSRTAIGRDITRLCETLGVADRAALIQEAREQGF